MEAPVGPAILAHNNSKRKQNLLSWDYQPVYRGLLDVSRPKGR